jgi:hypothetical protein
MRIEPGREPGVPADVYWSLPGPRGFLRDLDTALAEHGRLQQVLVAVPDRGAPPALAHRIADIADLTSPHRVVPVSLTADCDVGAAGACLRAAGVPLPAQVPSISDVVGGDLAHNLLVIDATTATPGQLRDLGALVTAAAAQAHNARAEEPLQAVAVLPGRAVAHVGEAPRLTVRWWWGRLGRLDTELLLLSVPGRTVDHGLGTAIAEVAGFDLAVALMLRAEWDGDLTTLPSLLLEYAADDPGLLAAPPPDALAPTDRPNAATLPSWSSGSCDLWDRRGVAWHASAAAKHEPERLARALWRAQAASVMPLVEEQRARVVAWLVRQGHGQRLREEYGDLAEIGAVWHYMMYRAGMRSRPQMDLATWLRDARNEIAHLRCLTSAQLQEGLDLIAHVRL